MTDVIIVPLKPASGAKYLAEAFEEPAAAPILIVPVQSTPFYFVSTE